MHYLANSSGMSTQTLTAFHTFLAAAGVSIEFKNPVPESAWSVCNCSRIMILALRSSTDVLSGHYDSLHALETHISNVAVRGELVPASTIFSNDLVERWNRLCAQSNSDCTIPTTVPRSSGHAEALYVFLKTLGVQKSGYLFTRSWFCGSKELQRKVIEIALRGQGAAVCGRVADFQAHVDGLALVT